MIIKIGNVSLLPWLFIPYHDSWIRYTEYGSVNCVRLKYNTLGGFWYPCFDGNMYFLRDKFEEFGQFDNHKHRHHQKAMDQLDKFLVRMGKLTSFI